MTLRTDASLDRAAFFNVFRAIEDEDGKAVGQQEASHSAWAIKVLKSRFHEF